MVYLIGFQIFNFVFFNKARKYMNISINYRLEKYFWDVEYKFD
jgi:multidrug transporter EmrE-like cation transporter